jgi:hypothetical protein
MLNKSFRPSRASCRRNPTFSQVQLQNYWNGLYEYRQFSGVLKNLLEQCKHAGAGLEKGRDFGRVVGRGKGLVGGCGGLIA